MLGTVHFGVVSGFASRWNYYYPTFDYLPVMHSVVEIEGETAIVSFVELNKDYVLGVF